MGAKRKSRKAVTARSRRPSRPARARGNAGFLQKTLVVLSGMLLVLCAASVTYSFFFRMNSPINWKFRVEVLNGTDQAGLAHAAARCLQRREIDVIGTGNAERSDYKESILIARKAGADVEQLGDVLRCRNIVVQLREDTVEDATLILGADFRELNLDWRLESGLLE